MAGRLFSFVFFFTILFLGKVSCAQTAQVDSQLVDSTLYVEDVVHPRTISSSAWALLTQDSAFTYADKLEAEVKPRVPSDFELWLSRVGRLIVQFLFSSVGAFIFWALVVLLLAYVLYRMFRGDFRLFFKRIEKPIHTDFDEQMSIEDVMNTDWESRLAKAQNEGDMRLSTRFLFVRSLQILHQKQHIVFSIDKTNFDYYRMISNKELKVLYRILMTKFEYVWFGHRQLNEQEWIELMKVYEQLKLKS